MTPFEREVLPHRKAALGLAMKFTRFREDAEELTQEALLRAWKCREQYQEGTNGKRWLMRIVSNLWLNRVKQRGSVKWLSLTGFESVREAVEWYNREERAG